MHGCGSGPGRAPRGPPSGVGQEPSACFQETESERIGAGLQGRWAGRIRGRAGASAGAETGEQVEVQEAEGVRPGGQRSGWLELAGK